ncbi:MAG: site-2 protease family protein, partial [Acidimicrobiales bacterium]
APVRFLSPVGQADISRQAVDLGLGASLQWFGILACAVGAINLLPLPPLDGSHAVVAAAEGFVQRVTGDRSIRFNVARLLPLAYATVGLLVALSISALILDVRDVL